MIIVDHPTVQAILGLSMGKEQDENKNNRKEIWFCVMHNCDLNAGKVDKIINSKVD
jgi:hypothetical protein